MATGSVLRYRETQLDQFFLCPCLDESPKGIEYLSAGFRYTLANNRSPCWCHAPGAAESARPVDPCTPFFPRAFAPMASNRLCDIRGTNSDIRSGFARHFAGTSCGCRPACAIESVRCSAPNFAACGLRMTPGEPLSGSGPRVFGVSPLLKALIVEATEIERQADDDGYAGRITHLILDQRRRARPLPAALPWPGHGSQIDEYESWRRRHQPATCYYLWLTSLSKMRDPRKPSISSRAHQTGSSYRVPVSWDLRTLSCQQVPGVQPRQNTVHRPTGYRR